MKLSNQRKVYLAVLGVGLAALGFDRAVLDHGSPQSAEASIAITGDGVATATSALLPAAAGAPAVPVVPIADQLAALERGEGFSAGGAVDAFSPSAAWLAADKPAAAAQASGNAPGLSAGERFARDHHLGGVMVYAKGGSAMIDRRAVEVGQAIDGYRLMEVTQRRVVLQTNEDERVEVALVGPISVPAR